MIWIVTACMLAQEKSGPQDENLVQTRLIEKINSVDLVELVRKDCSDQLSRDEVNSLTYSSLYLLFFYFNLAASCILM